MSTCDITCDIAVIALALAGGIGLYVIAVGIGWWTGGRALRRQLRRTEEERRIADALGSRRVFVLEESANVGRSRGARVVDLSADSLPVLTDAELRERRRHVLRSYEARYARVRSGDGGLDLDALEGNIWGFGADP